MKTTIVRLIKFELHRVKNVNDGIIEFMNYAPVLSKAEIAGNDIVGIYGQNGSGKTAAIEGLDIMRHILSGEEIPYREYGGILSGESELVAHFFLQTEEKKYLVSYAASLSVIASDAVSRIAIRKEKLSYKLRGASWRHERSLTVSNPFYNSDSILNISTAIRPESKHVDEYSNLEFVKSLQNIAIYSAQRNCSVFFNQVVINSLMNNSSRTDEEKNLSDVITSTGFFARNHLIVIKVRQLGDINMNQIIPLNIYEEYDNGLLAGCLPLLMNGNGSVPVTIYPIFERIIEAINIALRAIVPDLQILLRKGAAEVNEKGTEIVQVDVFSERNGRKFSTRYESEGIKRIISLLNCLIAVYNNPQICLAVDELDSGIFEYLLGELLGALYEEAKGQLIFTSHNLRAFEKLGVRNLICSTTNPDNRYLRLKGVQQNHNKRDFYIRALVLGGQKESLYDQDELDSIGYAFRKAGRLNRPVTLQFSDSVMQKLSGQTSQEI